MSGRAWDASDTCKAILCQGVGWESYNGLQTHHDILCRNHQPTQNGSLMSLSAAKSKPHISLSRRTNILGAQRLSVLRHCSPTRGVTVPSSRRHLAGYVAVHPTNNIGTAVGIATPTKRALCIVA
ncbi:uncharacterized protein UDID_02889 [Ustilago sp. UG-2017a]|nr:uncharacterized protein UDID_02889 [Ustilago sp. UG-2017a]